MPANYSSHFSIPWQALFPSSVVQLPNKQLQPMTRAVLSRRREKALLWGVFAFKLGARTQTVSVFSCCSWTAVTCTLVYKTLVGNLAWKPARWFTRSFVRWKAWISIYIYFRMSQLVDGGKYSTSFIILVT